jgi:hypothetical protein
MTLFATTVILILVGRPPIAPQQPHTLWQPANITSVEYRWWADDLYPPACTVQVSNHGSEDARVSISYRNHSSFRMQLSVLMRPSSNTQPAERLIIGCVSVDQVVAEPMTSREAKIMRPTGPAAIISGR